jgi:hypothetical protein
VSRWSVQILPSGEFSYHGRTIDFTRGYREAIAEAFDAGVLDVVPFALGDAYTGDPGSFHGEVTGLEVTGDGLDAVIEADPAGDAAVRASLVPGGPPLGAAPRLIENYLPTGGLPFPVILLHVLGTSRPPVTGLRGWRELEAAL